MPGCGGFGIRNFLTLFLSIEVSKAGGELAAAKLARDAAAVATAEAKIGVFTSQLDRSNPVLTLIADAMTAEGVALRALQAAEPGSEAAAEAAESVARWHGKKAMGNQLLQEISEHHKAQMAALRE